MLPQPLKSSTARYSRIVALVGILAATLAVTIYFTVGSNTPAEGAGSSAPPTQAFTPTPTSASGLYRDTNEGFSITLPPGWVGTRNEKPRVLTAYDSQSSPTVIYDIWVFRTSTVEDAADWLAGELTDYADDISTFQGQALAAAPGTTASQVVADYTSSGGSPYREVWNAFGRGTQMVLVRATMIRSTYNSVSPTLNTSFQSFTWETPAPFGASQSDSLFLSAGTIRTIDPALWRGSADGIVGALFGGLVKLNRDLEVEPEIAASWDVDESGTVYTFHIHPQAKFHDGRAITAADVKYSWERAADPELESATVRTYLGDIVGVQEVVDGEATSISGLEVVDPLTLKVTIDSPKSYFIQKLTYPTAYIVDKNAVEAGGDDWTQAPNGSGRYKLKVWEENDILILERVENHHLGTPKIKNIVYRLLAGIPMSMYEAGEIDIVGVSGSSIEKALDPENPLNADLVEGVGMCTSYVYFNQDIPPFDDIDVRRAFIMALDFDRYIDVTLKGHSNRASSILPPGMPGYTPGLFSVEYDPVAARELFEQTNFFKSGAAEEPILSYSSSSAFLWMWQQNLGVEFISVGLPESEDFLKRRDDNEFSFGVTGWCADYPDPQNFLEILLASDSDENNSGYSNSAVDALLEQAASEPDTETRLDLYTQAEQLVLDDWILVPYSHSLAYELVKPYVKNYEITPIGVQLYHELEIQR